MRWVISTALQSAEEAQYLQMADTQFFKLLKNALPGEMKYMGSTSDGKFTKLCSNVLESSPGLLINQTQTTPKKVAFLNLGGKLSRAPGAEITGETRTEQHNQTVVTQYKPKDAATGEDDPPSEEEENLEAKVRKLVAEQLKQVLSPAKKRNSTFRDGEETPDGAEKFSQDSVISLLKELVQGQAKSPEKKPTNNECFRFANTGSCIRGNLCKFEHQDRGVPPPYPHAQKRGRMESPPPRQLRGLAACFDFQKGKCRRGTTCNYSHEQGEPTAARQQPPAAPQQGCRDCENAKRTGVCRDYECLDYHGKVNNSSGTMCRAVQNGKPCRYMWTPEGCNFSHRGQRQENPRRPENKDEKNGRGSGRADRYKK